MTSKSSGWPVTAIDLPLRPLLRGRLVPGGAVRFTVQYEPNPGSVTGRGCRSNKRFNER